MTPGSDEAQFFERFYDSTLPKAMENLAKKYDGKFERGKLDAVDTYDVFYHNTMDKIERGIPLSSTGVKIRDGIKKGYLNTNTLRITPEMKEKVIKEGFKSFAKGGPVRQQYFKGEQVSKDFPVTDVKEIAADRVDPFTKQPYSAQMEELGLNVFQKR